VGRPIYPLLTLVYVRHAPVLTWPIFMKNAINLTKHNHTTLNILFAVSRPSALRRYCSAHSGPIF